MELEIIAFLAGLISSTAAIPQIVRMIRTRKTGSVSTVMFCMKNCSNSLWLAFGIYSGTYSIIFWNIISLALCTTVIVMKYKIQKEKALKKQDTANVIRLAVNNLPATKEPIYFATHKPKMKLVYSRPNEVQASLDLRMPESASNNNPQS